MWLGFVVARGTSGSLSSLIARFAAVHWRRTRWRGTRPAERPRSWDFLHFGSRFTLSDTPEPASRKVLALSQWISAADAVTAMAAEPASRRARGRPRFFSDEALRRAADFSYARRVRTRRGAQDLVYRKFAVAAIELYCEAYPEKAASLNWLLRPRRHNVLLSELGRVARPKSDDQGVLLWAEREVSRLIHVAFHIAEAEPSTKAGVAMIRDLRRRTTNPHRDGS